MGASGQLGTAFQRMLGNDAIGLSRSDLDLTRPSYIPEVLNKVDPLAVINCAAYTKVDQAEQEEELATAVNGYAVGLIAHWCHERGRRFLTFSTDYVFNGLSDSPYVESSPTDPINAYGRSKLRGEELVAGTDALMVRTSWVISGSHPNFVATMMRLAHQRQDLRVVDDQVGCPTVADDLAVTSYEALLSGVTGLLHLTNNGATTWYRLASSALDLGGISTASLKPCTTDEFPTKAKRPAYSVLASERLAGFGIESPPHWEVSLPGVVAEIKTWLGTNDP